MFRLLLRAAPSPSGQMSFSPVITDRTRLSLGQVLLEQVGDGTFELGQARVDLDHLVRADRVRRVDVSVVVRPLDTARTAVKYKAFVA